MHTLVITLNVRLSKEEPLTLRIYILDGSAAGKKGATNGALFWAMHTYVRLHLEEKSNNNNRGNDFFGTLKK